MMPFERHLNWLSLRPPNAVSDVYKRQVVTRSNKRANIFNQGIRNMVLDREEELESGDMLMRCV